MSKPNGNVSPYLLKAVVFSLTWYFLSLGFYNIIPLALVWCFTPSLYQVPPHKCACERLVLPEFCPCRVFPRFPFPTRTLQFPLLLRSGFLAPVLGSPSQFFPLSFTPCVAIPQIQHKQIQTSCISPLILFPILYSLSCLMDSPQSTSPNLESPAHPFLSDASS